MTKNGEHEGYGRYIYEDGNYYEGMWAANVKTGKGLYKYNPDPNKAESDFYDGNWFEGWKSGYGSLVFKNNDRYDGFWSV